MHENLLKKVHTELAKLDHQRAQLEQNFRDYPFELDFEVLRNDLEIRIWQEIKDVATGTKRDLNLDKQTPYFFFPPEIGELSNLTHLNLSGNSLSKLPSEIWKLSNLLVLNLSRNQLENLPSEINNLINLAALDISNNKLAELPLQIGQLTK